MHCYYELRYGFDDQPLFGQAPSFYDWVMLHMNLGLRDGPSGRVEESLSVPPFGYVVLSITYFILVVLILGAVISGIIIDAFASKREETAEILLDKQSVDFVSGLKRTDFEQYGVDFDRVVGEQHSMWNYMYYKVHLDQKDHSEHDGPESYINAMINEADPSFYPLRRCAELEAALDEKAGLNGGDDNMLDSTASNEGAADGGDGDGDGGGGGGDGEEEGEDEEEDGAGVAAGAGATGRPQGGGAHLRHITGDLALMRLRQQRAEHAQAEASTELKTLLTGMGAWQKRMEVKHSAVSAQLTALNQRVQREQGRAGAAGTAGAAALLSEAEVTRLWDLYDVDKNGILEGAPRPNKPNPLA